VNLDIFRRAGPAPLLAGFTVMLLLVIWGVAAFTIDVQREQAIAGAREEARNQARALEEHAERTFQSADQAVLFLKYQYERVGKSFDIAGYLSTGVIQGDIFTLFTIVDDKADVVLSNKAFKPMNLADREHIRVHMQEDLNRLFVGKPVLGRVSGKWSIQMTRRIDGGNGTFGGVVVVSLDPFYFTRFYRDFRIGPNGSIALVGEDGIVRARLRGTDESVGQDVSRASNFPDILSRSVGDAVLRSDVDGEERLYAWRRLKHYPLYVVAGYAMGDVLAPFREQRTSILLAATGASAMVLLFAGFALVLVVRLEESHRRAVAASEAKSRFLANMSHELRTPLNGILGYADLLREDLAGTEQASFAESIEASGRHLLALVNDVLDLGRIESGRMELNLSPERLQPLLEEAIASHGASAAAKGLTLRLDSAPGVPETLRCDRVRLMQVLNNLLHNAIKFTDRGTVVLEVRPEGDGIRLAVSDTGPGIPADKRALIFERFTQADDSLVRNHQGTGLGLALARDLARVMGGRLWLESRDGPGATFALHLPAVA